ncbi:MAG: branched-chain amino acid ABC transporter substrate-binding protein [Solirubrobacteraceae bacterium]
MRIRVFAIAALAALAIGVAACGGSSSSGGSGNKDLTVYSSLPLQGASRVQNLAVISGAKLRLSQAGGKVNQFNISYKSLDDSTASAGTWDPGQVSKNARTAASDESTIAYIGEFNSGASAVSIPILNQAGILTVSPSNTAVGLTTTGPGADKGEPAKYYPTGKRTYVRVVPRDTIQGAALATLMKQDGCTSLYILNDKSVYGAGLAKVVEGDAAKQGIKVDGNEGIDPKASNYRSQAAQIKSSCFMFSGTTDQNGVQVYKDVAAADPNAKLYGPDGVAEAAFTNPAKGGIPASIAPRVQVSVATLDPKSYPPAGQKVLSDLAGGSGKLPDPYAIYGYAAMDLVLHSIKAAGDKGNDRQAVIDEAFKIQNYKSVLGTYSIDKNGDTSLTDYGIYTIKNGQLTFEKAIKAQG